jgi:hypothetical protein
MDSTLLMAHSTQHTITHTAHKVYPHSIYSPFDSPPPSQTHFPIKEDSVATHSINMGGRMAGTQGATPASHPRGNNQSPLPIPQVHPTMFPTLPTAPPAVQTTRRTTTTTPITTTRTTTHILLEGQEEHTHPTGTIRTPPPLNPRAARRVWHNLQNRAPLPTAIPPNHIPTM